MKGQLGLVKGGLLALMLISFGVGNAASGQDQFVSIAILNFQDDTSANAPAELGQKLAQDLHQKVAVSYKDLLPRVIAGIDAAAVKGLTIEQIAALGKQQGAKFVIRGGLLTVVSEPAGPDTKITVQLYADVISADTAALISTVRAEASGMQSGPPPQLSAIDARSDQFSSSGIGQAFAGAVAQLAESIHQTIAAASASSGQTTSGMGQPAMQPGAQPDAAQAEAAKTAEADAELQQLIAQAQSLISSGANTSTQSMSAVSQALQALQAALQSKAALMEKGQDASQADQEIAMQRQALQTAVAQVTAEASGSPGAATTGTGQQPGGQRRGFMERIDEFAGQALSTLQKIQQIRTTLRSFHEPSAYGPSTEQPSAGGNIGATEQPTPGGITGATEQPTPGGNTGATEQQLGEANGVVTDQNGNPVPNAQVTDQDSGATTSTDGSGQYNLTGLLNNQVATLVVKVGDQTMSAPAHIISERSATVDFQFKPTARGITRAGVLPSTVILDSQTGGASKGILKGVVRDAQGRPVPRALVTLKGLGVARTNSQGEYQFLNVPAGPQQLIFNQSGLQTKTARVQVSAAKSNEARIQFAPSDKISTSLVRPSLIVSGSGAAIKGVVFDSENHPLAGAKVSAIHEQSALAVFTAANGAFEIRNLKPGPYRLIASKAGYENSTQNLSLSSNGSESVNFQLKQQSSPLVASLLRNEMARRGVIRGRVLAANGGVIANAAVTLKTMSGTPVIATGKTNQNGEYLFNVREGQYEVHVSHSSYQAASRNVEARAGGLAQADFLLKPTSIVSGQAQGSRESTAAAGQPVRTEGPQRTHQSQPGAGAPARVQVVKTGGVLGQVLDAKTGRPIAGATVSVSGQRGTTTDSAGSFALTNLSPGGYQVNISKTGYLSLQRTVSVNSGETIRLSVSLTAQSAAPIRIIRRP